MGRYEYRRLVHGTTLHGTQVSHHERHVLDDFQFLTVANPLDNIAVLGATHMFDMRQEPLTYYHRTGPVGAMFSELTRRGKEKEHVAMVGLGTGSAACYAQKGQRFTFYEIDPAVKRLVADTDKYFTYVRDAERRGAHLDFRMGDARLKLKETDDKYALLLVDAFSSDSIPVHLLTVEAVGLYLDRMTDDGILALHISNKFVRLEPVVAAIAEKHGLVARVWNDDAESRHGKTASSWVALARKPEHLGDRLCSPVSDLMVEHDYRTQLLDVLQRTYPELRSQLEKSTGKQQETILAFLDKRIGDPQAQRFAGWIRKYKSEYATLMDILKKETDYGFRPVDMLRGVEAWTDDYADVMRVMMIKELQAVRKFFGLPTPVEG
jgi:spermidine synthase